MRVLETTTDVSEFFGCSLVPTMGALHAGHRSLIERARQERTGPVVVTLFVNPTQFGPGEDFSKYPRTMDEDVALAEAAGADAIFIPNSATMYPAGLEAAGQAAAKWPLPPTASEPHLEDRVRPGHFGGVCQVVSRLFDLCRPAAAYFGEKDFQQVRVISQMVEQSTGPWRNLRVVACPTQRDVDGLAISSRNRYLTAQHRVCALGIFRALTMASHAKDAQHAESLMHSTLVQSGVSIDYAVVRDAFTLCPTAGTATPRRALIAVRLPTARLIDNMAMPTLDRTTLANA